MTTRGGSGGPRQPANPAPVSGPGALSARTDGGPGSKTQPIRKPTGLGYGEAGALEAQQRGAPLPAGGGVPGSPVSTGAPGGGASIPTEGVFGPSTMGGAPPGIVSDPTQLMAQNPQAFLRVLAAKFPHPALRRLVDWSAMGSNPPRGVGPRQQGPPTTMSQRTTTPLPQGRASSTRPVPPGAATAENFPTPREAIEQGP